MNTNRHEVIEKLSWVINEHSLWDGFAAARDEDVLLLFFALQIIVDNELGAARERYIVLAETCATNILGFYMREPFSAEESEIPHRAADFVLNAIAYLKE